MALAPTGDRDGAWSGPRRWLVPALIVAILAGCATGPEARQRKAETIAAAAGFVPHSFEAGVFQLTGFLKAGGPGAASPWLAVYLEGDGLAWRSRYTLSDDPTPLDPVGLELAVADRSAPVLYLARPCQYTGGARAAGCDPKYWSSHRFAPEVVEAVNRALDRAMALTGARTMILHGYSGGGPLALLVAGRRNDVAAVVTIAGPLDLAAWTRHHNVTPLSGSLDPATEAARVAHLPQLHLVGADDTVVPPEIVRSYLARAGQGALDSLRIIPDADHNCCWAKLWPELQKLEPGR